MRLKKINENDEVKIRQRPIVFMSFNSNLNLFKFNPQPSVETEHNQSLQVSTRNTKHENIL